MVLDALVGALHARLVLDALLVAFHARLVLDALLVAGASSIKRCSLRTYLSAYETSNARKTNA